MEPDQLRDDLDLALKLADLASAAILPHYRRSASRLKADGTEVTDADLAAEQAIRDHLARHRPDDGILGEEFGEQPPHAGNSRRWVIDPLDGTAFFSLGLPSFSTLIALLDDQEPVLGVIHQPAVAETVFAARGLGCWWRREPGTAPERLQVAPGNLPLSRALAVITHAESTDILAAEGQTPYRLSRLIRSVREFRFAGDGLKHTLICRGRLHIAVDTVMYPWDIAALVPCVEEAGGITSSLLGDRPGIVFSGTILSTCDQALHEQVLRTLAPEPVEAC